MQSETELSTDPAQPEEDLGKALELKKLALEIAELERSWWKRPTYILAALPTLLAVAALTVGFLNGFFSAQLTKLENQKHDLQTQVSEFETKRDALHLENETLTKESQKIKEKLADVVQEIVHGRMRTTDIRYQLDRCQDELYKLKTGR